MCGSTLSVLLLCVSALLVPFSQTQDLTAGPRATCLSFMLPLEIQAEGLSWPS